MYYSVVIPLYNKENHIQRAINSVLNQTIQDFELIIVDDGSTDGSFEVANAIQDPRIRIIRQENRGVSAARNRGIMEAKHDWVAFLDADDEWLPGFLEEIINLRSRFPECSVAATGYYLLNPNGVILLNNLGFSVQIGWRGIIENYAAFSIRSIPFNSSSFAATKNAIIKAGMYSEDVTRSEDLSLYLLLSTREVISYAYTPLSIYHLEAENRSWVGFTPIETHVTKVGKEILGSLEVTHEFKQYLYEELVRRELIRVRELLHRGKRAEALGVLNFCDQSEDYSETVKKLRKWSRAPYFLYRLLYSIKYRVKILLKHLNEADH
ncbi:MAG TPA: glycosyltransferase family A protein [Brevefilum sp.]|nr:glycosyltransferase family A protein [Brevefilum sp.]HOR20035.1 glycosyltransferase family A protein [Brevefilum sp.]HPL69855.1 glycosyltransferase family A protein [Brevefilum sp.]